MSSTKATPSSSSTTTTTTRSTLPQSPTSQPETESTLQFLQSVPNSLQLTPLSSQSAPLCPSATPLGDLSCLPGEIRNVIYHECAQLRSTGLLFTNKQIYSEAIPPLEEKFVLSFLIDPAASSSTVKIVNQNGQPWGHGGRNTVDARSPHPDHVLQTMPIDKFAKIRLFIDAPNPKDPGQLVRAWYQTTRLLAALLPRWRDLNKLPRTAEDIVVPEGRKTTKLPPVEITFRETGHRKWSINAALNHSLPSYKGWDADGQSVSKVPDNGHSDMEVLLTPFLRIRDAASLKVQLPSDACPESQLGDLISLLQELAVSSIPFGMNLCLGAEDNCRDDDECLAREDALHIWLDCLLDDMDGPTAALVRRERFQHWCPEYEHQLGCRLDGFHGPKRWVVGGPASLMHPELVDLIAGQFSARFAAGWLHERLARSEWNCRWRPPGESKEEASEPNLWEKYFPTGIINRFGNANWGHYPDAPWHFPMYPQAQRGHSTLTADRLVGEFSESPCRECALEPEELWGMRPSWWRDVCVYIDEN